MKIFIKMINSDQIITSFGSDKILSLSFSHWITKKLAKSIATHNYSEGNRKENFKGDRTLLDYRVMVQHTGERKQAGLGFSETSRKAAIIHLLAGS